MSANMAFAWVSLCVRMRYSPTHVTRWSLKVPLMIWCRRSGATSSYMLQSTLFFAWTFPWSCDPIPPSRQATSAQGPATHYIPQCYATRPHEQATTPYESTPCGGPPSSSGHVSSYVYRATARAPSPGTPHRAPHPHPLEYPSPPVLLYGGVRQARDAEPGILARGRLGQSYVRRAPARARSSHTLLAGQPRRPHAYPVT